MSAEIKQYWEGRAEQHASSPSATTNDVHLRELEIATLVQTLQNLALPEGARLLDVGCGDGYSTVRIAEQLPQLSVLGIDYSDRMIAAAASQLAGRPDLAHRIAFRVGDALDLESACGGEADGGRWTGDGGRQTVDGSRQTETRSEPPSTVSRPPSTVSCPPSTAHRPPPTAHRLPASTFNVVLTDRCLINLESAEHQERAIAQIAMHTRPEGYYVAIENFVEGQEKMNELRRSVGLPEIPIRWHNRYFTEPAFRQMVEPFFEAVTFSEFASSYYFATRVIYSAMCRMRGEEPDYNHEIHQIAPRLPWFGDFSPIRMAVMRRREAP